MAQQGLSEGSLLGQTLGHYRIVDLIGEGGMGVVYRAYDEHLCCDVAIKVLLPGSVNDQSARKRFRKEARILSRLNHPNIAIVHDFDTDHGVDYLVMEYVPGVTLGEKLASSKPSQKDAITLGIELADGLSAAHERGVIHRDLKPGNLRLTEDGRLKVLDFGLARLQLALTPMATTASLQDAGIVETVPHGSHAKPLFASIVSVVAWVHIGVCSQLPDGRRLANCPAIATSPGRLKGIDRQFPLSYHQVFLGPLQNDRQHGHALPHHQQVGWRRHGRGVQGGGHSAASLRRPQIPT